MGLYYKNLWQNVVLKFFFFQEGEWRKWGRERERERERKKEKEKRNY